MNEWVQAFRSMAMLTTERQPDIMCLLCKYTVLPMKSLCPKKKEKNRNLAKLPVVHFCVQDRGVSETTPWGLQPGKPILGETP